MFDFTISGIIPKVTENFDVLKAFFSLLLSRGIPKFHFCNAVSSQLSKLSLLKSLPKDSETCWRSLDL